MHHVLPVELRTDILLYTDLMTCVLWRDREALRAVLQREQQEASCPLLLLYSKLAHACIRQEWSDGLEVLIAAGVYPCQYAEAPQEDHVKAIRLIRSTLRKLAVNSDFAQSFAVVHCQREIMAGQDLQFAHARWWANQPSTFVMPQPPWGDMHPPFALALAMRMARLGASEQLLEQLLQAVVPPPRLAARDWVAYVMSRVGNLSELAEGSSTPSAQQTSTDAVLCPHGLPLPWPIQGVAENDGSAHSWRHDHWTRLPKLCCVVLGDVAALRQHQETAHSSLHPYFLKPAVVLGHLAMVRYLLSCVPREACRELMLVDDAAKFGRLEVVRYLHENGYGACTTRAMDSAAMYGHLSVVRFLNEHWTEGCTTWAMDLAAERGHYAIVRYLHDTRTEGCTRAVAHPNESGSPRYPAPRGLQWLAWQEAVADEEAGANAAYLRDLYVADFLRRHRPSDCKRPCTGGLLYVCQVEELEDHTGYWFWSYDYEHRWDLSEEHDLTSEEANRDVYTDQWSDMPSDVE
ncbi:hypothetical protein RI367_002661 [Sorochytrium milnesiophthora]